MKLCSKCRTNKPASAFDKSAKYKSGLRSECKNCRRGAYFANVNNEKAKRKAWRVANAHVAKANHAKWLAENKAHVEHYQTEYRNREENKARKAALKAASRPEATARERKRQAAKLRATPAWADDVLMILVYRLAAELSALTGVLHQVDHTVPLQSKKVCGLHSHTNLSVMPKAENIRKGNRRWPDMWL